MSSYLTLAQLKAAMQNISAKIYGVDRKNTALTERVDKIETILYSIIDENTDFASYVTSSQVSEMIQEALGDITDGDNESYGS